MKAIKVEKMGATLVLLVAASCFANAAGASDAVPAAPPETAATPDLYQSLTDAYDNSFNTLFGLKSLPELDKAVVASPNDAMVYSQRGDYFHRKNQDDKARADYQKAIRLDSQIIAPHVGMCGVYRAQKDVKNALIEYGKIIALESALKPVETGYLRLRGDYFAELGRDGEALADYDKAIALEPNNSSTYLDRAQFFQKRDRLDKALLDYNKIVESDPKSTLYLKWKGEILCKMQQYNAAIDVFTQVFRLDQKDADARDGLGRAYLGEGIYSTAQTRFDEAIALQPKNARYYADRALNEVRSKNWTAAQSDLDKSIELDKTLGAPYFYRALLMLEKTNSSSDLTAAIETSVTNDVAQAIKLDATLLATVFESADKYANSLFQHGLGRVLLTGATQGAPENVQAWIKSGDIQLANYKSEDAIASYTRALSIDAKSLVALKARAMAYFSGSVSYRDAANYASAVVDWKNYLAQKPNDIDAMQQMGVCQFNAAQTADGIATFRKVLKADNSNAYGHLVLGLGLAIQNDKSGATSEVQNYVAKATNDEVAKVKSEIGSAKYHYPTNETLKTIYNLVPDKPKSDDNADVMWG